MDRKEAWIERPKHGQKRSMDRKSGKHDRNMDITEARTEKVKRPRPKIWTEKAEKSEKHHRNTDRKRGKHDRNMDRKLDNHDLLRKKLGSFFPPQGTKQTNKQNTERQAARKSQCFLFFVACDVSNPRLPAAAAASIAGGRRIRFTSLCGSACIFYDRVPYGR